MNPTTTTLWAEVRDGANQPESMLGYKLPHTFWSGFPTIFQCEEFVVVVLSVYFIILLKNYLTWRQQPPQLQ